MLLLSARSRTAAAFLPPLRASVQLSSVVSNGGRSILSTALCAYPTKTAHFSTLTVVELKALLRKQGSTVSGRKSELVRRLSSLAQEETDDAEEKVNGFSEMNIPPRLVKRLSVMGLVEPTPIQKGAIPQAIQGRDVMGVRATP